jgi:hypothetical protein
MDAGAVVRRAVSGQCTGSALARRARCQRRRSSALCARTASRRSRSTAASSCCAHLCLSRARSCQCARFAWFLCFCIQLCLLTFFSRSRIDCSAQSALVFSFSCGCRRAALHSSAPIKELGLKLKKKKKKRLFSEEHLQQLCAGWQGCQ